MDDPLYSKFIKQLERLGSDDDKRSKDSMSFSDSDCSHSENEPNIQSEFGPTGPMMNGRSTGPKGVLNDHRKYKALEKELEREKTRLFWDKLNHRGNLISESRPDINLRKEDDDEFSDDEFMLKYYEKRRAQLNSRGTFGQVKEISYDEYNKEIDEEGLNTIILIHFYSPKKESCRMMNEVFDELSYKYPKLKFLKIVSEEEISKFHIDTLPIVLVYQNKELLHSFIKITDNLSSEDKFTFEEVEKLFKK